MAGIADFGTVKVCNEELKAKAENAWQKIRQYQAQIEDMSQLMNASSAYWIGRAGDTYRAALQIQLQSIQTVLETYTSYPKELLAYAGIYSETITQTESLAEEIQSLELF